MQSQFFQTNVDLPETWLFFLFCFYLPPSTPLVNPPSPTDADWGSPTEPLWLLKELSAYRPLRRAQGWRRPEPRATPFPGMMGAYFIRAVQASGQGKQEWDHSRRPECFLSATTSLPLSAWGRFTVLFFLGAHQEILGQHRRESARRNFFK